IRNTVRFLLANTADFDIGKDGVPASQWVEIDRYAVALTSGLQREVTALYDRYEFHLAVQRLQSFCSEDLGAFYLDVLKDRLYTTAATSQARRSAQTAIWHIAQSLLRLLAPILSFTAEEAWGYVSPGSSVFTQTWHEMPVGEDQALIERWSLVRGARSDVQRELEQLRAAGKIGSSLQAKVELYVKTPKFEALSNLGDDLRFVTITSQAILHKADSPGEERIVAKPSTDPKCERCWHYVADVGSHGDAPGLCGRCYGNLHGPGEHRHH